MYCVCVYICLSSSMCFVCVCLCTCLQTCIHIRKHLAPTPGGRETEADIFGRIRDTCGRHRVRVSRGRRVGWRLPERGRRPAHQPVPCMILIRLISGISGLVCLTCLWDVPERASSPPSPSPLYTHCVPSRSLGAEVTFCGRFRAC